MERFGHSGQSGTELTTLLPSIFSHEILNLNGQTFHEDEFKNGQ